MKVSMKLLLVSFSLVVLFSVSTPLEAKSDKYIFRSRVNWVKINKARAKDVPLNSLVHPYKDINVDTMEAILLSLKISKKSAFKGDIQTQEIFDSWEARRFAPHIVEGLSQINKDQVIHVSVLHKRPKFLLKNDYLTMMSVWVATDGIHFQFQKIFARLKGDYLSISNNNREIREAQGLRTSLEAGEGLLLAYDRPNEIVADPKFAWIDSVQATMQARAIEEEQYLAGKGKKSETIVVAPVQESPTIRLRRLEKLRKDGLVSEEEYQKIRKKILEDL